MIGQVTLGIQLFLGLRGALAEEEPTIFRSKMGKLRAKYHPIGARVPIHHIEFQSPMIIRSARYSVYIFFLACSMHIFAAPEVSVPPQAFGQVDLHPNGKERGVVFHVTVEKSSYKFVNNIRDQLQKNGFQKCEKSAISVWSPMPNPSEPDVTWLTEMYSTDQRDKIALLRVEQHAQPSDEKIDQKFSVFFQDIDPQMRNTREFDEFCGKA